MPGSQARPVYLNLLQIRLPVAGVMSIVHRITGLLMFLATPVMLYLLDLSLSSPNGFARAGDLLQAGLGRVVLFGMIWGLLHHLLAGIRYLLLDVHIGVEKPYYRYSAWAVIVGGFVLALAMAGMLS